MGTKDWGWAGMWGWEWPALFSAIFGGSGWLDFFFPLVSACGHGLVFAWGSQALGYAPWRQMGVLGCAMSPLPLDLAKLVILPALRLVVPRNYDGEGTRGDQTQTRVGRQGILEAEGSVVSVGGLRSVCEFVIRGGSEGREFWVELG